MPNGNPQQEEPKSALEQYGMNLTDIAREGKLDPVLAAMPKSAGSHRC